MDKEFFKTELNQNRRQLLLAAFGVSMLGFGGLAGCAGKKIAKGTMRVALAGGPDSLDPMKAEFAIADLLFRQYMKPIISYGANAVPAPSIAKSWVASPDFKTWTFEIFPDLKWSDGKQLSANDVVESLQFGADPKTAYPNASELFGIVGYRDAIVNGKDPKTIGVKLDDENKIVINLIGADANFPARMQEFYPVPMHAIENFSTNWTDIGKIIVSGPYIPIERTQTRLVFDKNTLGGWVETMPAKIEIETVDDSSTRVRMFQSKDVDLAQDPPLLRYEDLESKFGTQFSRTPAPRFVYLSINTKRPQFSDPEVRRALSMGFDRELIAKNVLRGSVHPASRFIRGQEPLKYDKAVAIAILSAKGFTAANPLRFELLSAKEERQRAAVQIASQWQEIGVEVVQSTIDSSAISTRLNGFDFDAAVVGVDKGMKRDPIELMGNFATGGNSYSHGWQNHDYDAALSAAMAVPLGEARTQALVKAESYLLNEVPVAPIWFGDSTWLIGSRIKGGIEGMAPIIWPSLSVSD